MEDVSFELWDLQTHNVITAFADETAALIAVEEAAQCHGQDYARSWALIRDDDDATVLVAQGDDLLH